MVEVVVGQDDALDPIAGRAQDGVEVALVIGARIDHPARDDVGVRAVQRHRRRVVRAHAHDAVREPVHTPMLAGCG